MAEAYRIEIDKKGCEHCSGGTFWTVVGPGDVGIGSSWGDREHAEDIRDLMNMAFEAGREHDIAEAEKQLLGDPEKRTGIYAGTASEKADTRDAIIEECAEACEQATMNFSTVRPKTQAEVSAAAIRALKNAAPREALAGDVDSGSLLADAASAPSEKCAEAQKCLNPPKAAENSGFPPSTVDALLEPYIAATRAERAGKNQAYLERSHLVAALARLFPAGIRKTKIEGWSPDWDGCVYIDLPTGQISYHYHDSHAHLFDCLPPYSKPWDGHDKDAAHARLSSLRSAEQDTVPRSRYNVACEQYTDMKRRHDELRERAVGIVERLERGLQALLMARHHFEGNPEGALDEIEHRVRGLLRGESILSSAPATGWPPIDIAAAELTFEELWKLGQRLLSARPSAAGIDAEAITWALGKLEAFGLQTKTENALMMDRLKLMVLDSSAPPAAAAPKLAGHDLVDWLKSWWSLDEMWRDSQRKLYGPDVAHLMRGVADMIERCPPPAAARTSELANAVRAAANLYCTDELKAKLMAAADALAPSATGHTKDEKFMAWMEQCYPERLAELWAAFNEAKEP